MTGMTSGGNGAAPGKAYYSNGPGKSPMSKNRRGAAVRMLTNAGKTASAKGTSAMMSAHRQKKKKVDKMEVVMKEFKEGKLHSGSDSGPKVTNRKQAVAIGMSEQKKYNS